MMNQTNSSTRKTPTRPDNSYSNEDLNVNNIITSMQNIRMSQENTEYTEEYHSNNMLFEGYNDNDDEVFEEFQESRAITITREPRMRRISDVIDSIGCSPSSPVSKTSSNFEFTERALSETEERSISIVRRESEVRYHPIQLDKPPVRRAMSSVTDSLASPPPTPGSDLGYCSASLPTPPPLQNLVYKPKWFRFSGSSPPKIDTMDAQMMCAPEEEQQMKPTTTGPASEVGGGGGVTPLVYPQADMPVSLHSLEYNMGHAKRGYAVIFNHETFTMDNTAPRVGSKLDAVRLQTTLEGIGFTVETYHDLDSDKIKARINELSMLDHSDCDCVLVAVLSHGMGTSYILSHDYPYPVDMLWSPFIPDRCPTLAGKPKLFLIQACRGEKLDGGVQLVKRTQVDSDSGSQTYKIPAMADFLIAYSTAEGFYSWRNPQKGTWFIQSLCEILEKQAFSQDLQTLLLMVAHKVALEHESFSDLYPWQHQQKQVPQTVSTLIRKIHFQPKA